MKPHELQLLEGLRAFLARQPARLLLTEPSDWPRLWKLCAEQKVLPMVLDSLAPSLARSGQTPDGLPAIRRQVLQITAAQLRRSQAFLSLYQRLRDGELRPLVVKGIVCRSLYPKPDLRPSADEDLLVHPDELPRLLQILRSADITLDKEDDEQVISCRDRRTGLYLEFHRSLFSPSSHAYGELNNAFTHAFRQAAEVPVDGHTIWTLAPQQHMLYLILHSLKHFLHSGFGIRQVCDICLFARAHGKEIDWNTLGAELAKAHADLFGANLLEIGRRYLGFTCYPAAAEKWLSDRESPLDCNALLADLLSGGIYGGNSPERLHSSRITLNAVTSGGGRRLLRTVFPRKEEMTGAYPYLSKCPWLLPVAWSQRIWRYGCKGGGSVSARKSIAIGENRVALLKKYRVIR